MDKAKFVLFIFYLFACGIYKQFLTGHIRPVPKLLSKPRERGEKLLNPIGQILPGEQSQRQHGQSV